MELGLLKAVKLTATATARQSLAKVDALLITGLQKFMCLIKQLKGLQKDTKFHCWVVRVMKWQIAWRRSIQQSAKRKRVCKLNSTKLRKKKYLNLSLKLLWD